MSAPESVTIVLPNGALGGWPVLIDALRRAEDKTGLDMVFGGLIDQIQRQTDPKPEQPTGLGAVVETRNGSRYVRVYGPASDDEDYECWKHHFGLNRVGWSKVDAVKVLNEGVSV